MGFREQMETSPCNQADRCVLSMDCPALVDCLILDQRPADDQGGI